jgi:crotonobetainyl-CoA:carnitine CoA-transferase CaiB-like acyl-CoA transferase
MLTNSRACSGDLAVRRTTPQGWEVPMSGVVPKFSRTPGAVQETGPALGAHTRAVPTDIAGMSTGEIA